MNHIVTFFFLMVFFLSCSEDKGKLMTTSNTIAISESDTKDSIIIKAAHVVPTSNQYEALKNEFIAFIHFGPNTFTRMEWGSGMEDPRVFNLKNLDTDQWCRAMHAAGMKKVILTAKHHDGFCLWQSRYTKHGIMSTPFENGKGDIMRSLSASCKKYGLKLGVYLSPADLFQIESPTGLYGNLSKKTERVIPRPVDSRPFENTTSFKFVVDDYNEYFLNQLFELLTEYGPIHEVWFDGAHPKRKGGQQYNYMAWKELIHTLAPEAVIFGKEDIRWCGNESGGTRKTEWNVIPYMEDPNLMKGFGDLTNESLGSREELYKGKFLHYQPAETNTSIREGWFYRDDTDQKVRSADDVFDIYERSVGGNSIFLLNIPPNRNGEFSERDIVVLEEVGKRIRETYHTNIFEGARGPKNVLDDNLKSYLVLDQLDSSLVITSPDPVTINRFVIQEAITTHSERIEKHAVDAWIDHQWQQIASASNVGYKRILRFPSVTSDKFRLRILESRLEPAVSNISAHFYKSRPAQLVITRDKTGIVRIEPKKHPFGWKPHGENSIQNINEGAEIRYTLDGSEPNTDSKLYKEPFFIDSGRIQARTFVNGQKGSVASELFGIAKADWKLVNVNSEEPGHGGTMAFDGDAQTYWLAKGLKNHYITIDLGKEYTLTGFSYTPQVVNNEGMIEKGLFKVSLNGKKWTLAGSFVFGNLINDPTQRRHDFKQAVKARFVRVEPTYIAGEKQNAAIAEIGLLVE